MKIKVLFILTFFYMSSSGQISTGEYQNHFGYTLELKQDSTFRYNWCFDLMHEWVEGKWSVTGDTINLKFVFVYDTLTSYGKPDSLILSIDGKSNKISKEEYLSTIHISSRQCSEKFCDKFFQKRNRLYMVDKNGELCKRKQRSFWTRKKFPTYYFRKNK